MKNDPFEHIRRIQEMMNRMNIPLQQIQRQIDMIQPFNEQVRMVQQTYGPMLDAIQRQQDFTKAAFLGAELHSRFFKNHEWLSTWDKLAKLKNPQIPIPDAIYPYIEKLSNTVLNLMPQEDQSDLIASLTVRSTDESKAQPQWTWETLKWFLNLVVPIIITIFLSIQSSEQLEHHHQEEMQQRERHHRELMEQNERHHQEVMDAYSSLMEIIEPYLLSDQDKPENETEDPGYLE
ncbi:hypothetical protein [Paenibacillus naphthalenovorans]|uniref:hypothetical protein n=1 Tax=Paenibacillus naphthalenovorans TaxID=162209 RepID=UPI000891C5C4|nr:hypothetical protein [Paenibacillus naphthalenovorans]SDJ76290.1 hypothetical protein SAMN05421868_14315 [Paenibacillus naphthalenovorans]